MLVKLFKQIVRKKLIVGIIIALIITGSYFGYQRLTKDNGATQYVTAAVEKGTLIVSLSGSGQVSASDQVDIKPKVSGELTALYVARDQEVETGELLAVIDTSAAQRAVNDAEIALESAKIDLEELLSPPDAQSLLQVQNALAQAERDFEIAKRNYESIDEDAENTLASAYEDGYSDVSTAFFKLSSYIDDLKDVCGTENQEQKYIGSYKLILGENSPLILRFSDDYYQANYLYGETFTFFGDVFRDDERDQIYKLINDTFEATEVISRALESARHMYDAITTKSYHRYWISYTVDSMKPRIESDLSGVFSLIGSLQNTIDIIDNTVQDTPDKIKDAELALKSAEEKFADRKLVLEELEAGADSLDIRTQQNIVAQREASLAKAKAELADHYIYAPFSSVVVEVNNSLRKGDTVSSGSSLATIITKQKLAEISLNEIDIAQVKTGQKANITFDAVEDLNITGEVVETNTLGTVNQGVVTYGVKIAFDAQDERVKPGMTLSTAIITEAKQDVLLVQSSAIKQQGDILYVQMADGSVIEPNLAAANISGIAMPASSLRTQQVQVGSSNDTMTEIVDGLKEGDIVIIQAITLNSTQNQAQQSRGFSLPGMSSGGVEMRMIR